MVLSSPVMSWASCWLRVGMSPPADTSTNSGDRTSSSPYWSRELMALDQLSSIFWNSFTCGPTSLVATDAGAGAVSGRDPEAEPGETAFWAETAQQESRKAE